MSLYKGHLAGGIFSFILYMLALVVFFSFNPNANVLIWFGLCLLGALWPDVDTNSLGQKLFYGIFVVLDSFFLLTGLYKEAALLGFFALLPIIGKHRGWTHTIWAAFLVPSPMLLLPVFNPGVNAGGLEYYVPVVIGYLSHLILDWELNLY
ncbi:MAG: metal-dependent hydrolase [Thermodesulfobacteriota bacterium]